MRRHTSTVFLRALAAMGRWHPACVALQSRLREEQARSGIRLRTTGRRRPPRWAMERREAIRDISRFSYRAEARSVVVLFADADDFRASL